MTARPTCTPARYPGGDIPDEVVAAVRERVYGVFDEDDAVFMADCQEIVQTAFNAWRPLGSR
jgi:hypothetical protein